MGRVHGRVTLDGKPLAGATVLFTPVVRGLRHSDGITNENGEYILKYIREEKGATVGKNSVRITKLRTHAAELGYSAEEVQPGNDAHGRGQVRRQRFRF